MSPVRVTWRRTLGRIRSLYVTALAFGGFLAAAGALFAFNLAAAEGERLTLAAVWCLSVSPALPVLAALLAMDVWSEERQTGRIELLLTAPVRERQLVAGKFFGVLTLVLVGVLLSLAVTIVLVRALAPAALADARFVGFLPACFVLALQGALWSAAAVAASAFFCHAAGAAAAALTLTVALPRGLWAALTAWAPQGRPAFGEMPLDAHALDMALGVISPATAFGYLVFTFVLLFVASKTVAMLRLVGRGAGVSRASTVTAALLAVVCGGLLWTLALRLDTTLDVSAGFGAETRFSPRTRAILADGRGEITVTCFLPRRDRRYRTIAHFLRSLSREAEAQSGLRIETRYVDPRWDLGEAARLVREGAKEGSIVFSRGRRIVSVPLGGGWNERVCASAILQLTMPPARRTVYWTHGHGEPDTADYGAWGLSDIARDLARDGYRNLTIDLGGETPIPSDCALIVVAGAKEDFSRAELGQLDAYLKQGGRMLALMGPSVSGGVASLLPGWGIRPAAVELRNVRTISGTDVLVDDFSTHPIAAPLQGSQLVMERPVAFSPSAAVERGAGADRIGYTPLANAGGEALAAIVERGVGAGSDLGIRPTRIVAVGDASFVMNGQLASRANANRDFLQNCVAYLSGVDAVIAAGTEGGVLTTGMDRATRLRFVVTGAAVVPGAVFLLLLATVTIRRRRR